MDCNRIDEYVYAFRLAIPRTSHCCLTFSSESVLQMIEFQIIFVEIEKVSSGIVNKDELLGGISLLSPEYLLSFERCPFHTETPDHYALVSYLIDL